MGIHEVVEISDDHQDWNLHGQVIEEKKESVEVGAVEQKEAHVEEKDTYIEVEQDDVITIGQNSNKKEDEKLESEETIVFGETEDVVSSHDAELDNHVPEVFEAKNYDV